MATVYARLSDRRIGGPAFPGPRHCDTPDDTPVENEENASRPTASGRAEIGSARHSQAAQHALRLDGSSVYAQLHRLYVLPRQGQGVGPGRPWAPRIRQEEDSTQPLSGGCLPAHRKKLSRRRHRSSRTAVGSQSRETMGTNPNAVRRRFAIRRRLRVPLRCRAQRPSLPGKHEIDSQRIQRIKKESRQGGWTGRRRRSKMALT